ncbi:Myb domain plants domain-containing protein [Dioscorea alata]|uniref:Myb domain plants domain-containing protein n=1 Tax=Dioscorea alata TaxID=55571 RepID=A0ACB7W310_DIOAL|nr:Myb domain plants domain-containing protein [Dioscorea alata]
MGSPPSSELTLDYKPNNYALPLPSQTQSPFTSINHHDHDHDQLDQLQDFLSRLQDERSKIEAFQRELPLCMQLINNAAMEAYKQQLETLLTNQGVIKPVLEEFIPLKTMSINESDKASDPYLEKASWMVSAQLWNPASDITKKEEQEPSLSAPLKETQENIDSNHKLPFDSKQRNGGAFLPFSKDKSKGSSLVVSPGKEMDNDQQQTKVTTTTTTQTHRKARRCWSPDLHRRFVNALQILGGSQVATPKQIRELMKVDGLTNDEVKSHLQKYRLHTRRPMPAPQPATAPPQLVVLGGIWVPPQYTAAHAGAAHYCAPPMAQEFYPATGHHHYLQPSMERSSTVTTYRGGLSSPESEGRSGGDRSESIEEEEAEEREDEEEEEMEMMEKKKALAQVNSMADDCSGLKF